MKAVICTKWGSPDYLELQEVDKPIPKDNEVLIRVCATTVSAGDCELRGLKFAPMMQLLMRFGFGFRGPRKSILGQELAGEIEAVGKDVKLFKDGDQIFAHTGMGMGAYAEYNCLPEKSDGTEGILAIKPPNMTYEEAAAVPLGGLEALHYLRKAKLQSGEKLLINGAGGSIGTIAVQLAKHLGAEVTAIDSTKKLDMLRLIGADQVIDYTQEDFTESGQTYDVIFDVVGKSPFSRSEGSLTQTGRYLTSNPPPSQMFRAQGTSSKSSREVLGGNVSYSPEGLYYLKERIEAGDIKSVIDRTYPLEQMAEAHRFVDRGGKLGNVVITVEHVNTT
ncbi:MAG: zinc-binding dehydrogenase [Anaerolineales bacterium]|nr:zinc-binding dehydrogenase [Anaerolineales bacterium]